MRHQTVLEGRGVRLVPLATTHAPGLAPLVDDVLWAGMTTPAPTTPEAMAAHVQGLLDAPGVVAFAVLDTADGAGATGDGALAGVTTFYDLNLDQGRVEVGHTFYGRRWWGSHVNPAAKLALLTHAFETWGVARVALRADARNTRSLQAIARLGAVREGTLRSHRVAPDGTRGDTVYFSVLAHEWPSVRAGLEARLGPDGVGPHRPEA